MLAYAVGFEAGVRGGRAAPGAIKGGWHLTGTLGSIAAGVAAGRLVGLDGQRLTYAMGIAATQAGGMQQNRGTSCKSFHAGKAAANGVLAALLAERGFDSTQEIIEGRKGLSAHLLARRRDRSTTAGLGGGWVIETVPTSPMPAWCSILIDAMIALRERDHIAGNVAEIKLRVPSCSHHRVVEPSSGLQSKFSTVHSAAVALLDGAAGIAQYSDARARDPVVAALRRKVTAVADETLSKDEAYASIVTSADRHDFHIAHASGTAANPMSDAAIEAKFLANATPVIGGERAQSVVEFVRTLERQPDVRDLIVLLA
jgi:2-methylcitrate dehydratase PrpD